MGFVESGWSISNGMVTHPNTVDGWEAYKFIQEAVYDGHLPVTRAIGYCLRTSMRAGSSGTKMLRRFQNCADDRMSIVANLSKLLFVSSDVKKVYAESSGGQMLVSNTDFIFSTNKVHVLSTQDYILTAIDKVAVDLMLASNTGYVGADENYECMQKMIPKRGDGSKRTRYLPMFSYHNIMDFVHVLPYSYDGSIRLRYFHGMTDEILTVLFERLFNEKPDSAWLNNYKELIV